MSHSITLEGRAPFKFTSNVELRDYLADKIIVDPSLAIFKAEWWSDDMIDKLSYLKFVKPSRVELAEACAKWMLDMQLGPGPGIGLQTVFLARCMLRSDKDFIMTDWGTDPIPTPATALPMTEVWVELSKVQPGVQDLFKSHVCKYICFLAGVSLRVSTRDRDNVLTTLHEKCGLAFQSFYKLDPLDKLARSIPVSSLERLAIKVQPSSVEIRSYLIPALKYYKDPTQDRNQNPILEYCCILHTSFNGLQLPKFASLAAEKCSTSVTSFLTDTDSSFTHESTVRVLEFIYRYMNDKQQNRSLYYQWARVLDSRCMQFMQPSENSTLYVVLVNLVVGEENAPKIPSYTRCLGSAVTNWRVLVEYAKHQTFFEKSTQ